MKKLMAAFGLAALVLFPVTAFANSDQPSGKPKPTIYAHEEDEEGDESLIAEESVLVGVALVTGVGTIGYFFYRRNKGE